MDNFTARGSFKGAGFWVRGTDLEAGQRTQVHEYPLRDKPYVEELGRKGRKFQFDAYCLGDNYIKERDALIKAVESGGAGNLKHPWFGSLTVKVINFKVSESTSQGGYAAITLEFIEDDDNAFPSVTVNTTSKVNTVADQTLADAMNAFAQTFAISDVAADVTNFLAEVDDVFAAAGNVVGAVSGPMASLIRSPANLASAIAGAVTNISNIAGEPKRALDIYRNLLSAGDTPIVSGSSPRAKQAARNSQALNELVRNAALTESCRSAASMTLSPQKQNATIITRKTVINIRLSLLAAIDARQVVTDIVTGAPINDDLFSSLGDLRKAMNDDLTTRSQCLPSILYITPQTTSPALVLAYRQYGDASRETELVILNDLRHPGFVQGGQALEVLSE